MLLGWSHKVSGKYLSSPESHFSIQGPLGLPLPALLAPIKHRFFPESGHSLASLLAKYAEFPIKVTDYWWTLFILLWSC